jgi:glutathione S-transferase
MVGYRTAANNPEWIAPKEAGMYTLYIANKNYSSWSLRPWLLMRALGILFEERLVPLEEGSCWDSYRRFSPNGRVPCLHDGATVVWDSLAIVEYLAERHAGVWPENAETRAWARSVASEMHSGFGALRNRCSMNCGLRVQLAEMPDALQADISRIDEIWSEGLSRFGGPWLAGPIFCAADAFYAPVAFRVQTFDLPLSDTARSYADRILRHEAMVDWYREGLAEPWRETSHEAEMRSAGAIVADYRQKISQPGA